jgi:hypothetical protein
LHSFRENFRITTIETYTDVELLRKLLSAAVGKIYPQRMYKLQNKGKWRNFWIGEGVAFPLSARHILKAYQVALIFFGTTMKTSDIRL